MLRLFDPRIFDSAVFDTASQSEPESPQYITTSYGRIVMSTIGRSKIGQVGTSISVSADGRPERKLGGVTVDWSSVTAVTENTTYSDGVQVFTDEKALRYGQVLTLITGAEINTISLGGATGGNFTLSLASNTTSALNHNVSNATLKSALENFSTIGTGNVVVTGSSGSFTLTFNSSLGNISLTGNGTNLANGTLSINTTSQGGREGLYGPYDPDAVDGRATLSKGTTVIVEQTVKEYDVLSDHPSVVMGGILWKDRLKATSGTASKANGPTFADLETALPRMTYAVDN